MAVELDGGNIENPRNIEASLVVAGGFLGQGIKSLTLSEDWHSRELGAAASMKYGVVGLVCYAQGLELLLKAVLIAKKIPEPKGQHNIVGMFELLLDDKALQDNLIKLFSSEGSPDSIEAACRVVRLSQEGFMVSRYFGYGNKTKLFFPKARDASILIFGLLVSFFFRHAHWMSEEMELDMSFNFKTD